MINKKRTQGHIHMQPSNTFSNIWRRIEDSDFFLIEIFFSIGMVSTTIISSMGAWLILDIVFWVKSGWTAAAMIFFAPAFLTIWEAVFRVLKPWIMSSKKKTIFPWTSPRTLLFSISIFWFLGPDILLLHKYHYSNLIDLI